MRWRVPTLCVLALAAASAPWASASPGATVTGIAFHDANGNGSGPEAGEEPLAGWIVWADDNGNGVLDPGEPSTRTGEDGRYRLAPLAAGDHALRIAKPDGSGCPSSATCSKQVTLADGDSATVDFPIASATNPGSQLLDGNAVRVESVRLTLPRGCRRRPFGATVSGFGIRRVDITVDGSLVRNADARTDGRDWTVRIDPRPLPGGRHRLTADVWLSSHSSSPRRRLSRTFRSCSG